MSRTPSYIPPLGQTEVLAPPAAPGEPPLEWGEFVKMEIPVKCPHCGDEIRIATYLRMGIG